MTSVTNHWSNYQNQINKYLSIITDNPYYNELVSDFSEEKINKIVKYFDNEDYKSWVSNSIKSKKLSEKWVDVINFNFIEQHSMELFCGYIFDNIKKGDIKALDSIICEENLNKIIEYTKQNETKFVFSPSELKFVTTTGIAYLNCEVDYKFLYEKFIPPTNVIKHSGNNETIFNEHVINKVIGCKTGDLPVKGYFKKEQRDFFNCATLNIVLTNTKCANVKLFGNGKLQLTGIPHPDLGIETINIIMNLIKSIPNDEKTNNKIVFDKKHVTMKKYNTVMINTCYELGLNINRDVLYEIITNRYGLSAIYESDGYPGVRVEYFYNKDNTNTEYEGKCNCKKTCNGKESKGGDCKRLSIAIFQSGSVIIAGGCDNVEPIHKAYNLINKIIGEIYNEIRKLYSCKKKRLKKKNKVYYLEKNSISDLKDNELSEEQFKKLVNLKL